MFQILDCTDAETLQMLQLQYLLVLQAHFLLGSGEFLRNFGYLAGLGNFAMKQDEFVS